MLNTKCTAIIVSLLIIPIFSAIITSGNNVYKQYEQSDINNNSLNASADDLNNSFNDSEISEMKNLTEEVQKELWNILEEAVSDSNANTTKIIATGREGGGGGGGKGGKGGKKGGGFLQKILPFMVIPFMISSSMIPMALTALKFMLIKSAFIGKIAIILLFINMFIRSNNQGGVYSHNLNLSPYQKEVAYDHYGYGGDEYGIDDHGRRRR